MKSITATLVVWLQNDNGFNLYKPSDAAVDAFLESYRPGRDKITEAVVTDNIITTNNNTENNKATWVGWTSSSTNAFAIENFYISKNLCFVSV